MRLKATATCGGDGRLAIFAQKRPNIVPKETRECSKRPNQQAARGARAPRRPPGGPLVAIPPPPPGPSSLNLVICLNCVMLLLRYYCANLAIPDHVCHTAPLCQDRCVPHPHRCYYYCIVLLKTNHVRIRTAAPYAWAVRIVPRWQGRCLPTHKNSRSQRPGISTTQKSPYRRLLRIDAWNPLQIQNPSQSAARAHPGTSSKHPPQPPPYHTNP